MSLTKGHKANYATIMRAARRGDLALLECIDAKTGEPVATLCAVNRHANGDVDFVPLAKLFDANPYEELTPPTGGDPTPQK